MKDLSSFCRIIRVKLCVNCVEWSLKHNGFRNIRNVRDYLKLLRIQVLMFLFVTSVTNQLFLQNNTLECKMMGHENN